MKTALKLILFISLVILLFILLLALEVICSPIEAFNETKNWASKEYKRVLKSMSQHERI